MTLVRRLPLLALAALLASLLLAAVMPAHAQVAPRCEASLAGHANPDGSISLHWTGISNVTGYQILVGLNGNFTPLTPQAPPATEDFTYSTTTPGTTYTFGVVAMDHGVQRASYCLIEVTAVPEFPSPLAAGLALVGGVGGSALLARRRV